MFLLEFPQNIIGLLAYKYFTRVKRTRSYRYKDAFIAHVPGRWGAVSLSRFIFVDDVYYRTDMVKHEYGHTIQSKKLLILYLPIIGIPSLLWNRLFKGYRKRHNKSYYAFYSESWANKLGHFDERVYQQKRLAQLKKQKNKNHHKTI